MSLFKLRKYVIRNRRSYDVEKQVFLCFNLIASKRNANYLIKKCANIKRHHKPSKRYFIDAAKFRKSKVQYAK